MTRPLFWVVAAATLAVAAPALASPTETESVVPGQGDSIDESTQPLVSERPRDLMVWTDVDPATVLPVVNSNKIYLNNCKPNGCIIKSGNTSSIDGSGYQGTWGINGTRTLTAFSDSDAVWQQVVDCMKDTFSPFGVEITTTNPSPAPHFEIMIAGRPGDIGLPSSIGGVSPFSCQPYIPNSLVFDFSKVWGGDVEEICSTAAQEIAHSFALDHVTDPSDPLTYNPYTGRRKFKDAQIQCGSDCVNGTSPMGETCTGVTHQNHNCSCTNGSTILVPTQNSVATIKALFGTGNPTPPMVKITAPKIGAVVAAGFPVTADITDSDGVARAELYVDGVMTSTLGGSPWAFNAPATLANGSHTVKVIGYDIFGTSASDQVAVVIGKPCSGDSDCPTATDVCLGGRCVAGPDAPGGLGSTCTGNDTCSSKECAQDDKGAKYCVEICATGQGQCPSGFGCLDTSNGGGSGVCWPGFDDGTGGCCDAGGSPTGPMFLSMGVAALFVMRRKRK